MKCSRYFGAKRRGFINIKIILAPKGASCFRTQNFRYDTYYSVCYLVGKGIRVIAYNINKLECL